MFTKLLRFYHGRAPRRSMTIRAFTYAILGISVLLSLVDPKQTLSKETQSGTWHLKFEKLTETTSPQFEKPQVSSDSVTLLIGPQSYEQRQQDTTTFYTKKSKTLVTLYHRAKEHIEMPVHALVWFLNSETVNRHASCNALESVNLSTADMEPCSRFELESLFGYSHPQAIQLFEGKGLDIVRKRDEGILRFVHDGKEFVTFHPATHQLGLDHKQMFRRFLAHQCQIHPEIRQDIFEQGNLPIQLTFRSREGASETTVTYKLENATFDAEEHVVHIPKDFIPQSKEKRLELIIGRAEKTSIPDVREIRKQSEEMIDKALASNRIEEAVLTAHRFYVVTDNPQVFRELLQRCGGLDDRQVRRMVYGLGNLREIKKSKEILESKQSKIAYLLDYYLADLALEEHRTDEPIKDSLLACLDSDPLIVGAYIDLWRVYLMEWDPYTAWRCVRVAQKLSPNHSNLLPLRSLEKSLEADSPDFF